MQNLKIAALFSGLSLLFSNSVLAQEPAEQIKACMQANLPKSFSIEEITLISESAEGSRAIISGEIYFSRDDLHGKPGPARAMMKLVQPAALRDSAYLVIESEEYARSGMFVYLPAVARVRRITGEMADGRLFGTDITYYDFKQLRSAMNDMSPQYIKHVQGNRPAHLLRFTPTEDINVGYDHVLTYIDEQSCLPLTMEFFDGEHLVKTLNIPVEAIRKDQDRWYPTEFTLSDHVYKTRTTMKTTGFRSDKKLSEKLFHPASFYRTN